MTRNAAAVRWNVLFGFMLAWSRLLSIVGVSRRGFCTRPQLLDAAPRSESELVPSPTYQGTDRHRGEEQLAHVADLRPIAATPRSSVPELFHCHWCSTSRCRRDRQRLPMVPRMESRRKAARPIGTRRMLEGAVRRV